MEEVSVGTGPDFIDWGGIEINEDRTRNMLVVASLGEEGLEGTSIADVGFGVRATISLQTVLEKVSGRGKLAIRSRSSGGRVGRPYNSQAALPNWVPACPMCRWQTWSKQSVYSSGQIDGVPWMAGHFTWNGRSEIVEG